MPFSRKHFLTASVAGASAAALSSSEVATASPQRAPVHYHIVRLNEYNHDQMVRTLAVSAQHKQVFQSVSPLVIAPGVASVYIHMQNAMNAYKFSLGANGGDLATLAVFIGPSIVFGLQDAMWQKYGFGKALNLAETNAYYAATSQNNPHVSPDDPNGMYQDWSAEAVMRRGGHFMLCHNAMTAVAGMFAAKGGAKPEVCPR